MMHSGTPLIDLDDAVDFVDRHQPVQGGAAERLADAARPTYVEIDALLRSKSKMQPPVIYRKVTRLRENFLRLLPASVSRRDARADRAPVRLDAEQFDLYPVGVATDVIAQIGRAHV